MDQPMPPGPSADASPDASLSRSLDRALDALTLPAGTDRVLASVHDRRQLHRRAARSARRRRRMAAGGLAAISLAACIVAVSLVDGEDLQRVDSIDQRSAPAATTTSIATSVIPSSTVQDGTGEATALPSDAVVKGQLGATVVVPGEGERIVSLAADGDGFWIARGDPVDATDPVVSTIAHVTDEGAIGTRAEIHGVPRFGVRHGDDLWVISEDRVTSATDSTRYRLKRIDAATGDVQFSSPLPATPPIGLHVRDASVRVVEPDGELVIDPATQSTRTDRRTVPSISDATQVVVAGPVAWTIGGDAQHVVAERVDVADSGSRSGAQDPLLLSGPADLLVDATAWQDGAAATTVQVDGRVDLVELVPPTVGGAAPASRTRVNGLAQGAALVAVATDRVWLSVGDRLAAIALD